jgi:hypothetical protein
MIERTWISSAKYVTGILSNYNSKAFEVSTKVQYDTPYIQIYTAVVHCNCIGNTGQRVVQVTNA